MSLSVFEIFESISGEVGGFPQGARAIFIRLGGCNLRCPYCDTKLTWTRDKSKKMRIDHIMQIINKSGLENIVITGGEPLLQGIEVAHLCAHLGNTNKFVTIETNGTLQIPHEILNMAHVTLVVDYKLKEYPAPYLDQDWHNGRPCRIEAIFGSLRKLDYIKFVVANSDEVAKATQIQKELDTDANFAYSPLIDFAGHRTTYSLQELQYDLHAKSMLIYNMLQEQKLNATINVQLHKILDLQ